MEDLAKKAEEIRASILAQHAGEDDKATKARWLKATEKRDKAIKKIKTYQDETGIPSIEEVNDNFTVEAGLGKSFKEIEDKFQEEK